MVQDNAERQRQFRERKKKAGLTPKINWVDCEGYSATFRNENGERSRVTQHKFTREINKITGSMLEVNAEEMLAELLAQARILKAKYDNTQAIVDVVIAEKIKAGHC
jgi:hypothetical protein